MLYGPNTMGGAINLITKKPTKEIEGSLGYGFETGKNAKTYGNNVDFSIGTKQELFYAQAGGSYMEDAGQQMSRKFDQKVTGNEDGGRCDNSVQRDKKFNIKFGFTPNETDEYAVAYVNQKGEKEQPFYTGRYASWQQASRYWDWPKWDKEGVYFLSNTQITDKFYVKSKLYYDSFENSLYDYLNKNMTGHRVNNRGTNVPSFYDDHTYGGGLEFGWDISEKDTLKFATSYKYDIHKEGGEWYNNSGRYLGEQPVRKMSDKIYSFVLENTYKFTEFTKLILGASYDVRDALKAEDWAQIGNNPQQRAMINFNTNKEDAINYQAAIKHSFDGSDEL